MVIIASRGKHMIRRYYSKFHSCWYSLNEGKAATTFAPFIIASSHLDFIHHAKNPSASFIETAPESSTALRSSDFGFERIRLATAAHHNKTS